MCIYIHTLLLLCRAKSCSTLVTPWIAAPRLLCPWDFPCKTGGGCHFLLQGISCPRLNPCLLHWQVDSLPLSHLGSQLAHSESQVNNYWINERNNERDGRVEGWKKGRVRGMREKGWEGGKKGERRKAGRWLHVDQTQLLIWGNA